MGIRSTTPAPAPSGIREVCEWTLDDFDGNCWKAGCNDQLWVLEVDDPKGNGMNFCPFCGHVLKQMPSPQWEDDDDEMDEVLGMSDLNEDD